MFLLMVFPFLLILTVIVHYVFLSRMAIIFETKWSQSTKLITIICCLFVAHIVEIFVYAVVYYFAHYIPGIGVPQQIDFDQWINTLYFSFVAYSSLGAGDLSVSGPLKILYGLEAINGLLLIAWSASFSLLAMNRVQFCAPCDDNHATN
ncbi:MAG: ion channel [Gammaproteobacteria bacterium]|nr:ion channel [Gammaproteobacteria bacterium]